MSEKEWKNKLYFGDCLDILKEFYSHNKEGFIDLIYIDPPFNSKRNYNILYEEAHLTDTKAQKEAFADTWSNVSYKDTLQEIQVLDVDLHNFLKALDSIRVSGSVVAYLTTMAIRIYYMHKVLKDTGSFYLHCDPNMSHYLKLVCDLIFGEKNFRNEITWKRRHGFSSAVHESNRFGNCIDIILFYAKSSEAKFIPQYNKDSKEYKGYVENFFTLVDENGRKYQATSLTNPAYRPNLIYEYKGYKPPANGWMITKEKMEQWDKEGRIHFPKNKDGRLRRKSYADELKGMPIQNLWDDIEQLGAHEKERLDFPTQKPEALLDRIIQASSNKNDLVADFFCGCGTTVAAAQKLKRRWIGADISHLAIGLIEKRLIDKYGGTVKDTYEVSGFPKDLASAKQLAEGTEKGRLKFQEWVIEAKLLGVCNPKKTADGGWDGHLTFDFNGKKETVLVEVKSGHVNVKNMREFIHVVKTQKASMGVLMCFKEYVTKPMLSAAKDEGYFASEFFGTTYDKIQIITVEDLLDGETVKKPASTKETFKMAQKAGSKHLVAEEEMF